MWSQRRTWIGAALAAAVALTLAARNFEAAFPVVSLDLRVTRSQVLELARERRDRHGWELEEARAAASFGLQDRMAKTYVELEAGGREVWEEVVSEGEYRPYLWTVRLFREGRTREARVRFAPDGTAAGFSLRLPEDEPGASLPEAEARSLAETAAREAWGVRLERYRPVETATEARPGGRTDHDFVYERRAESVGDARFRLVLGVSGDRLTEVRRFVLVPEAFTRRYGEMRSSNDLIAFLATTATGLIYVLLGCGVGLFFLLRRSAVSWRGPLAAGFVVSFLLFGARLNQIPLSWMGYDTAVSEASFLARQVGVAGAILVGGGLLLTLVFGVAEGLTRQAYAGHPRLWGLWRREVAGTPGLLGRTLGGYLFTALFIPYAVAFYFVSTRWLGWWSPAEALVQPDLVATPLPWLSAVATSLFAGTFEEALFRAVPLAGAALLGERTGRRKAWIGAAIVLQALIFAAAHANYPQQPAYARAVELLLPSLAFGLVYVRFGVLPAVIGHFTFDLAWMSLPLWASTAPGVWLDRTAVVVAGLAPLGVVVVARLRRESGARIPESALNRGAEAPGEALSAAGSPVGARPTEEVGVPGAQRAGRGPAGVGPGKEGARPEETDAVLAGDEDRREGASRHPLPGPAVAILGAAGLLLWGLAEERPDDAPGLEVSRSQAEALAADTLGARGVETDAPWRIMARPRTSRDPAHRFVVEELGEARYRALAGRYLEGPGWRVRVARFQGSVEERAEEWRVELDPAGGVTRIRHVIPEDAPGDALEEAPARQVALKAVERRFGLRAARLEEVTAEAHQRPARRDWTFVFADRGTDLEQGQARIEVEVAGREVADARRFVHVPEEWRRMDRSRRSRSTIRAVAGGGTLLFALGALMVLGLLRWSRGSFAVRAFGGAGAAILLAFLFRAANGYPTTLAGMSTTQPLTHQLLTLAGGLLLGGLFLGAGVGLLAGLSQRWGRAGRSRWPADLWTGLAAGAAMAGVGAVLRLGEPLRLPPWPGYEAAGHALPWLDPALDGGTGFLLTGAGLLALMSALDVRLEGDAGRLRAGAAAAACLLLGYAFAAVEVGPSTSAWLVAGGAWSAVGGGAYLLVRRVGRAVLPGIAAVPLLLEEGATLVSPPFPGARAGAVLALLVVLGAAAVWTRSLAREDGRRRA